MKVYILEMINFQAQPQWRLISIYKTQESAKSAMSALYNNIYKAEEGYQLRTVERMVNP